MVPIIQNNQLTISATITSINLLNSFIDNLKKYPQITTVTISNISNNAEGNSVEVDLSAVLKGGQTKE